MLKPKEMADLIGVSVATLQRWDRDGTLKAYRNPKGRRYYTEAQYLNYRGLDIDLNQNRRVIAYSRVSNQNQKDDLKSQNELIKQFCNSKAIHVDDYFSDIGSGLDYKRENWNKLLEQVMNNEIETIYITYKDRFTRFGYDWFEKLCLKHQTNIIVLNDKKTSPEQEIIEDLISIIHVFSYRIFGLRKYKIEIKDDDKLC